MLYSSSHVGHATKYNHVSVTSNKTWLKMATSRGTMSAGGMASHYDVSAIIQTFRERPHQPERLITRLRASSPLSVHASSAMATTQEATSRCREAWWSQLRKKA